MNSSLNCVVALAGIVVAILGCALAEAPPIVLSSSVAVSPNQVPSGITVQGSFPKSARSVFYARSSKGLGGRLTVYRFSGKVDEILDFAEREYSAFGKKNGPVNVNRSVDVGFPIDSLEIERIASSYQVSLDWFKCRNDGVLYAPSRNEIAPLIFVDNTSGTCYFFFAD